MERIIGLTPTKLAQTEDELRMDFSNGASAKWLHYQDCCEDVCITDVNGCWSDLIGQPIMVAEERISEDTSDRYYSTTWTFYMFRTNRGSVDVRWCGTSNGYYSERVDFEFTSPKDA